MKEQTNDKINDSEIVKKIIEDEIEKYGKVHKFCVIEGIKDNISPIRLINKIWYEDQSKSVNGRLSADGIKNLDSGAKKVFRDSIRSLKKYFCMDSNFLISRREGVFKYAPRDHNYGNILISLLSNEWKNSNDVMQEFGVSVSENDAIKTYKARKNKIDKEEFYQIYLGKKYIFSQTLAKMVKAKKIQKQGKQIKKTDIQTSDIQTSDIQTSDIQTSEVDLKNNFKKNNRKMTTM